MAAKKKTASKKVVKKTVKKVAKKPVLMPKIAASKIVNAGIDYSRFERFKLIDENTIQFDCPNCKHHINISKGTGQCPVCDYIFNQ
jgi:Zn finger protein HypA/HybF involved in hydrogenase expression